MSHIRIIEITSSDNLTLLSARLNITKIDDVTGSIASQKQPDAAKGLLAIEPLIAMNREVTKKFKTVTRQDRYFGGIKLPEQMVVNNDAESSAEIDHRLRSDLHSLQSSLNTTFEQDSWRGIREGLLRSLNGIDPHEPIRLVILTNNYDLQALSIENTSFITTELAGKDRSVSVVFSSHQELNPRLVWSATPKILLILGNQAGIELPITLSEIEEYFQSPAIVTLLHHPSPAQVLKTISDQPFDIIIIVGHSQMNDDGIDGQIGINESESISIKQYTQSFKNSVKHGLKLVILAGCSSIGAARALAAQDVGIPNVIAFRAPVHYRILRLFFDRLFNYWIVRSQSLEIALTNTRSELNNYDRDCPATSILPILLTSPYAPPLNFPKQTRSRWQSILHILVFRPLVITKFRGKEMKIPPIVLFSLLAIGLGYFGYHRQPQLQAACHSNQGEGISCGEKILLKEDRGINQDKQAGADAIASGQFTQAIPFLTKAWEATKDPETLIMLENAKLPIQSTPIKSIALTIPASGTPGDIPRAMLKAVAYAQQDWNANTNHAWKLQVVLVNDGNEKSNARKVAKELLKRDIFAGIGSYSSEMTLAAKDIYREHRTALVSGTSTSNTLTSHDPDNSFYRVCSNNKVSGKEIAKYLIDHKYTRIALFHTPGKSFSDSMTAVLKENIQGKISVVAEFNFKANGTAADNLKRAKQAGAQTIVLIPDAYTSDDPERDRLLSIIEANNGELPIVGNEVIKDQTLFTTRFSKQQLQNLVISLPWHQSSYQNNTIRIPNFWLDKTHQLDHRIAMTYDATQVVITALDQLPINLNATDGRAAVQKIISTSTFGIDGITGSISFTGSDRSQSVNSLVQPLCDATKCEGFQPARELVAIP